MYWVDKKYLRLISSRFRNVKWKNEDLLNHSCPYCGDSEKDVHKARGYHFKLKETFVFKCHNCSVSKAFSKFLKDHDTKMYNEYCMEKFYKKDPTFTSVIKKTVTPVVFKDDPLKKVGCVSAIDSQVSRDYLNHRKIPKDKWDELYYIENCQSLSSLDPKYSDRVFGNDPRLVLPFYSRQGKLVGVSGRALNNNKLRYLTLKFDDDEPLIYGLRKVDYNKKVYVTEGPIDSLFLPNSIAVAGSDFSKLKSIVPIEQAVIVFDNERRNPQLHKLMEQVIEEGYTICFWPKTVIQKDINDMVLNGLSSNVIEDIINKNKFSGLSAKMTLSDWSKISG